MDSVIKDEIEAGELSPSSFIPKKPRTSSDVPPGEVRVVVRKVTGGKKGALTQTDFRSDCLKFVPPGILVGIGVPPPLPLVS